MEQLPGSDAPGRFTRRVLLQRAGAGALAFGVVGLAACAPGGSPDSTPGPTAGGTAGDPFMAPKEMRSVNGRLDVTLVAGALHVPWGAGTRYATTYNGTTPGPTLRVRAGDTLVITLRNELGETTNLHTHGLHVSPEGDSDNIFVMVAPGAEHTYTYTLPPNHPSGTFWYHPHHHGLVAKQVAGGMAGVIVVEDDLDDLAAMKTSNERVMVLADPSIGSDASVLAVTQMEAMLGREGDVVLVNGQLRPRVTATVGQVERWRLVNASASRYHRLSLDGATMHLIASDHGRLDKPVALTELLLTPGERAEVLVPLVAAGTLTLHSTAVDRGGMGMGMGTGMGGGIGGGMGRAGSVKGASADLVTLEVAAAPGSGAVPLPAALRPLEPVQSLSVDRARSFTLAMGMASGMGGMGGGGFTINGVSFDGSRVDTIVQKDTVEEWTIVNASMMDHPFHLHVWPMRVVSRSDGSPPDPGWRDTVNVPAGQSVVVRVAFRDFGGMAVYHCHILDHEDLGMMGIIDVR